MSVCVGCGMEVIDGVLQPKLDPAGGLECTVAGIKANFPAGVVVPGISDGECNGLTLRTDAHPGYFAYCPDAVTGQIGNDSINNDLLPRTITGDGTEYLFGSGTANTLANPLCCEVSGIIAIRAGGLYVNAHDGFYGTCVLQVDPNGGGLVDASPEGKIVFENHQGVAVHTAFNNFVDENWITIPAHSSITYAAALLVHLNTGSADLSGFIKFEYILTLPQSGCC